MRVAIDPSFSTQMMLLHGLNAAMAVRNVMLTSRMQFYHAVWERGNPPTASTFGAAAGTIWIFSSKKDLH